MNGHEGTDNQVVQREDLRLFGKRLHASRKASDLTQEAVAERLDTTRKTIIRWEHGVAPPPADKLLLMAKLYGVSVDWLLGLTTIRHVAQPGAVVYSKKGLEEPERLADQDCPFDRLPRYLRREAGLDTAWQIPNEHPGFGAVGFDFPGLQNGSLDGIVLVSPSNQVVHFLSYEGTFATTEGPASGETAADIGVREDATAAGQSLQLTGTGNQVPAFNWTATVQSSPGELKQDQDIAN